MRKLAWIAPVLLFAGCAGSHSATPAGGAHTGDTAEILVPAGTPLHVRVEEPLNTRRNRVGDSFFATLESPVEVDGAPLIPAGTRFTGRVTAAEPLRWLERPRRAGRRTGIVLARWHDGSCPHQRDRARRCVPGNPSYRLRGGRSASGGRRYGIGRYSGTGWYAGRFHGHVCASGAPPVVVRPAIPVASSTLAGRLHSMASMKINFSRASDTAGRLFHHGIRSGCIRRLQPPRRVQPLPHLYVAGRAGRQLMAGPDHAGRG